MSNQETKEQRLEQGIEQEIKEQEIEQEIKEEEIKEEGRQELIPHNKYLLSSPKLHKRYR